MNKKGGLKLCGMEVLSYLQKLILSVKQLKKCLKKFLKQNKKEKFESILFFILSLLWNSFTVLVVILIAKLNNTIIECIFILTSFFISKHIFRKAFHLNNAIHCFIVSNLTYYVLNRITMPIGISIFVPVTLGVGLSYFTSKLVKKTYKPLYKGMSEYLFEETILKVTDKDYDKIQKIKHKIGIIIPNYNYEHTIKKCLSSILNQTYKNYEIIFVDDMSTDKSVNIAKSILKSPHKIIELKQKRYNGGARNEAYLHLSDDVDYVYYIDSDDWLYDENALEKINNKLQTQPDVLFVGMASYKNNRLNTCFIPQYKDKYEAIKGWSGSCGKVIKKSLATRQECLYNEGTLKEDKNQHCKICIYMNDFKLLQEPVYVWNQQNYKSVTTIREKVIWGTSTIRHYADTKQLLLSVKGKDEKIDKYLQERLKLCEKELRDGNDRQW